ncbi:MAG: MCP four helix bundle domain-containing protein [Leptospiraceae bacterium]|nr:MCP four helix bundle domain-containing protein [Leptospiraceae bacterium]MCP5493980.1 MCP four helix bundle domain-containing protein [Leptospiraceae bacterium]
MKWFKNLKIGVKVVFAFTIVLVLIILMGAFSIYQLNALYLVAKEINSNWLPSVRVISNMNTITSDIRISELSHILSTVDEDMKKWESTNNSLKKDLENEEKTYVALISSDEERKMYEKYKDDINAYYNLSKEAMALSAQNFNDQAKNLVQTRGREIYDTMSSKLIDLVQLNVKGAQTWSKIAEDSYNAALRFIIILAVSAIVIGVILGMVLSSILSAPIKKLTIAAQQLSKGDIDVQVQKESNDEIGTLMESFSLMVEKVRKQAETLEDVASGDLTAEVRVESEKDMLFKPLKKMVDNLNGMISELKRGSYEMNASAKQVSQSSQMLSDGASQQASSVEEITSALTEIESQTQSNAQNSGLANELAIKVKTNAVHGNEQMKSMLGSMEEISTSSVNISKIIKVIDDIAFQTNILALNAAVEAARAGQHGKGFAVVAEEVRNLAARSANAAKETTVLIEGSVQKVEVGKKIANNTADALNKIVEGVTEVTGLIGQIAIASTEQATGISEVSRGVNQVSQVTVTTSQTAEETASASESLSKQSMIFNDLVSRFKLRNFMGMEDEHQKPDRHKVEEEDFGYEYQHSKPSKETKKQKIKISLD